VATWGRSRFIYLAKSNEWVLAISLLDTDQAGLFQGGQGAAFVVTRQAEAAQEGTCQYNATPALQLAAQPYHEIHGPAGAPESDELTK
jgi:hypothetical protein